MSKKVLIIMLTIFVVAVNQFLAKTISSSIQVPETVVNDVAEYIMPESTSTTPSLGAEYLVTKVIDGDTIEINMNGQNYKVRYIGMDTPETVKSADCFGSEATLRNKQLVEGQKVRLVKDVSETDKYGRLLRYVYVGDIFVNMVLVNEGYAKSATYPPDVKYYKNFLEAEKIAREEKVGLWGKACSGVN